METVLGRGLRSAMLIKTTCYVLFGLDLLCGLCFLIFLIFIFVTVNVYLQVVLFVLQTCCVSALSLTALSSVLFKAAPLLSQLVFSSVA